MEARSRLLFVGLVLVILTGCRTAPGRTSSDSEGSEAPPTAETASEREAPSTIGTGSSSTGQPAPKPEAPSTIGTGSSSTGQPAPNPEAPPTARASGPETPPTVVRPSALAGAWYPGERDALAAMVDGFLDRASAAPAGFPIALIAPHAGLRYSGPVAGHAYAALRGRTYGRVFVIGPAHRGGFHGVSVPDFTHYETPLGRVPVDREAGALLRTHRLFAAHDAAHRAEHSVEIQLPFLQRALDGTRWTFVPLLAGRMSPEEAAEAGAWLRAALAPGDLVVASSDFTHWGQGYGYEGPPGATFGPDGAPEQLPALMEAAWAAIRSGDPARFWDHKRDTGDTICGFLPIAMLMAAVPEETTAHLRTTDTSGAISGDWSRSVSYLAAQFSGLWPYSGAGLAPALRVTGAERAALLRLARGAVELWVREGRRPTPEDLGVTLTPRLEADSGVFVTLKKGGRLRGCIGNIPPSRPLFQAVLDNAVNAAVHDRRFPPVTAAELDAIEVEVSVLTPPVPVAGPWDVILGRHGVWIEKGGRSAVFLPQVAPEQGWTLPETLGHLSRKAGLPEDAWTGGMAFQVMEAIVFSADSR
jgi:AmmeMemoRadiSam system protein B/AmmeMemoRadiSam system protein A